MKYDFNISRPELDRIIEDWIFDEKHRKIMKRRLLDSIKYEQIAEEFDLSSTQIKTIVKKNLSIIRKHTG